jgi:micrococcal nuclease
MHRIALLLFLLILFPVQARAWTSKVVKVASGDSLIVLAHGNEVKLRLYGIKTPSPDSDDGRQALEATSALLAGRLVSVDLYEVEEGGIVLALLSVEGKNINKELVKGGFARVDREKCRAYFCDSWIAVEKEAEQEKLGIWRQKGTGSVPDQ